MVGERQMCKQMPILAHATNEKQGAVITNVGVGMELLTQGNEERPSEVRSRQPRKRGRKTKPTAMGTKSCICSFTNI